MRRTDGKTGRSYRHPNYRKYAKLNHAKLRQRRKEEKYTNEWRHDESESPLLR